MDKSDLLKALVSDIGGNGLRYGSLIVGIASVLGDQTNYILTTVSGIGYVAGCMLNREYEVKQLMALKEDLQNHEVEIGKNVSRR